MFLEYFRISSGALAQIFFLGALGYLLVKVKIISSVGLETVSRITVDVTLPALIFCQFIRDFSFAGYPQWWIYPLLSLAVTLLGWVVAFFCARTVQEDLRGQFSALVTFQNSGFLPLAIVSSLLPASQIGPMRIYICLFLLGFNVVMFSIGVCMLRRACHKSMPVRSFFSAPVIATIITIAMVALGLNKLVPAAIVNPLQALGECTIPLSMLVVGGGLALVNLSKVNTKAISLTLFLKLFILPLIGLLVVGNIALPPLMGLLLMIQLAVPSAVLIAVLLRTYEIEDTLASHGIFFSHLLSLLTLPVFLSLYFTVARIR